MEVNLSNQEIGGVYLDVITAMVIISQIQLATRHSGNTGPGSEIAKDFAMKLQEMVIAVAPENAPLMEMGWNPAFDI